MSGAVDPNEFTHPPPTPATTPLYAAVREAEAQASRRIDAAFNAGNVPNFAGIADATRDLAAAIWNAAPACPDRDAAIRAVRLARMAFNEAAISTPGVAYVHGAMTQPHPVFQRGADALREARWWACAAIAINVTD